MMGHPETDEMINRLQGNYSLDIRQNTKSTEDMRKAAWALLSILS
jgi:hypothetical protein